MQQQGITNGTLPKARQLKYQQVETEVRKLAETLPVNAKMPTERELAANYGCSVLTVRKGLKVLADEGIIRRRMGSGTFIARHSVAPLPAMRLLGLLTHSKSDAYAYQLLQSIGHAALEQSIQPRSLWIKGFDNDTRRQIEMLAREGCTAFVLPWFPPGKENQVREFLHDSPVPVSLPQPIPGFERFCFVEPQLFGRPSAQVVEMLVRYFSLLGSEHIAFIGPDAPHSTILQCQLVAYTSAMSRQQRPVICQLVAQQGRTMDELAKRWSVYRGKLAVISYDDEHALRLMTAMHKIGLSAPEDFRIVGFNNTEASRFSDPPLSTVAQNYDFISEWLIRNALASAEGRVEQASEIPNCNLLIRATCGGAGHVDDTFRAQLPGLTLVEETAK
ncbi:MAG: substrate-binding domain-containing protein [Opitutaceae bacterium]|nr:substrate-binding domain-containing protein [Opitutaceae bacterium]